MQRDYVNNQPRAENMVLHQCACYLQYLLKVWTDTLHTVHPKKIAQHFENFQNCSNSNVQFAWEGS